jgi:hypothetical protein
MAEIKFIPPQKDQTLSQYPEYANNPLFTFPKNFDTKLQDITPLELAQSMPYISLELIDLDGKVIKDLSIEYFQSQIDMTKLGSLDQRYPDRPNMSLKGVEIKLDTSNSGFINTFKVRIDIKIHKPSLMTNVDLVSFLFPNAPLRLKYGWSNAKTDSLLNQKECLNISTVDYSISYNEAGEVDLTVNCSAFRDSVGSVYIGDVMTNVATSKMYDLFASTYQIDGIERRYKQLEAYLEYVKTEQQKLKDNNKQGSNEYKLLEQYRTSLTNAEQRTRGQIKNNYELLCLDLSHKTTDKEKYMKGNFKKIVRVRDVVEILCTATLDNIFTNTIPNFKKLSFIFGDFNDDTKVSFFKNIGDFPIIWDRFIKELGVTKTITATQSLTINDLLTKLRKYITTPANWEPFLKGQEEVNFPEIEIYMTNRIEGAGSNEKSIFEIYLMDSKKDIPITTKEMPTGKAASGILKQQIMDKYGIPTIKLGHANSFIKNISFTTNLAPGMKEVLICQTEENRALDMRNFVLPGLAGQFTPQTPLTLPIKGEMTVIGTPEWKPFKAIFIDSGIYFIDGIYKIIDVTHTITPEGFFTKFSFLWN